MSIQDQLRRLISRFLKMAGIVFAILAFVVVLAYHGFVHWQFSKLPENRSPTSATYSSRLQQIFWHSAFGPDEMKMQPMPFWKFLYLFLRVDQRHTRFPQSFRVASMAGKTRTQDLEPRSRTIERHFHDLFVALWISKHWSAEEAVNSILEEIYFCHDFRGLRQASVGFYGVAPEDLSNEEMVFLSGISKRPCAYSPWSMREQAEGLAPVLLKKMSAIGVFPIMTEPAECFKRLKEPPAAESGLTAPSPRISNAN